MLCKTQGAFAETDATDSARIQFNLDTHTPWSW